MGHKRSIETIISKNSCFLDDKRFCPIFPRIIECDKTRETTNKSPEAFLTLTVKFLGAFFWDTKCCCRHKFLKNGKLSFGKNFAFFSRNIEHDKCQGTIHKVPEANLTNILQAI